MVKSTSEVIPTSAVNSGSPVDSHSLVESRGAGGSVKKATVRAQKAERIRILRTMLPTGSGGQEAVGWQLEGRNHVFKYYTNGLSGFFCSIL
jgi:hypothetical protein